MTDPAAGDRITYRIASDGDLLRTREVFLLTAEALDRRNGVLSPPPSGVSHVRAMHFREHSRHYDPDRYWVAESHGVVIGYAAATQRGRVWYLASLYVLPEFQARGVGSALLDRCLATEAPDSIRTTISEASQPISNALYMRRGMVPQTPFLAFTGPTVGPPPATDLRLEAFPAGGPGPGVLDAFDADALGFVRPQEHEFWSQFPDLHGYVVMRGHDRVGYLYLAENGAIGPAALGMAADLAPAIELAIAQAHAFGAAEARVRLVGESREAVAAVVRRRFRLGGSMTLFLSSRAFVAWDRYLSSGSDTYF
ncbi:MAG: GNAT family N-acetyltransferase [Candidatus Limnocylindrales bacterium]